MCILEGSTDCHKCGKRIEYNFSSTIKHKRYCDKCYYKVAKKNKARKAEKKAAELAEFKAWKKAQALAVSADANY